MVSNRKNRANLQEIKIIQIKANVVIFNLARITQKSR